MDYIQSLITLRIVALENFKALLQKILHWILQQNDMWEHVEDQRHFLVLDAGCERIFLRINFQQTICFSVDSLFSEAVVFHQTCY